MPIPICLLADRPELIGQLAAGYQAWSPAWYGPGGRGDALADLQARAGRGRIPIGLVAADGDLAAGTVALAGESMSRKLDFGAWLVGLWVAPQHRRQGVGLDLVKAAVRLAAELNVAELCAGTVLAGRMFERAGWRQAEPILHDGRTTRIFLIRPDGAG